MTRFEALEEGRAAFTSGAWADAYARLSAADREDPLEPDDLDRLAAAARLVGRDAESTDVWTRAYQGFAQRRDTDRAARCAVWLATELFLRGEMARGGGWVARASRLVEGERPDSLARGYLLVPMGLRSVLEREYEAAHAAFAEAAALGDRFGDPALAALGRHGQGRALLRAGEIARGMALLDEVMVAVTAGELPPVLVGDLYCSVLEACHESYDLRRAREWTTALARWCESQPDLVPYRGLCLVRHAEMLQRHGAWPAAMEEAERARDVLTRPPPHHAVGAVLYQLAELHRLRGEGEQAEAEYRDASQAGADPQPGLALLRLAQGQVETAAAAMRRLVAETRDPRRRPGVLAASVEILLAAGDLAAARSAADELARVAEAIDAPLLRALAGHSAGTVLLAEGQPQDALASLGDASAIWRDLDMPHEAARGRVLVGLAHRALGDDDTATLELTAARRLFERLGAAPDLAALDQAAPVPPRGGSAGPLTARERQVLGLVATGRTNRAIADRLGISQKTVARHVSNIFTKLGVSSRAAATAWAYRHRLLELST